MDTLVIVHKHIGHLLGLLAFLGGALFALQTRAGLRKTKIYRFGSALIVAFLDIQIVVGLISFFRLPAAARPYVHPAIMLAATVCAHVARRRDEKVGAAFYVATSILTLTGYLYAIIM